MICFEKLISDGPRIQWKTKLTNTLVWNYYLTSSQPKSTLTKAYSISESLISSFLKGQENNRDTLSKKKKNHKGRDRAVNEENTMSTLLQVGISLLSCRLNHTEFEASM